MGKMRHRAAVIMAVLSLISFKTWAHESSPKPCGQALTEDPHLWLEEIESDRALEWVKAQNERTRNEYEAHPTYAKNLAEARHILFAKDRVPISSFGRGYFWDFWEDETHSHGLWRRTTYDEYVKVEPKWETLLDLDELSKRENENWVFKGAARLAPESSRRLVQLSRGGKDATVVREFDTESKTFIADGFNLPEAKTQIAGVDENEVLVATYEGPDSVTTSNYPRIVRRWTRGQKFEDAPIVFTSEKSDLGAAPFVVKKGDERYPLIAHHLSMFETKYYYLNQDGTRIEVPLPKSARFVDILAGQVFARLREAWVSPARTIPAGSLIRLSLADEDLSQALVLFTPNEAQAIQSVNVTKDRVVINLIEHVRGKVIEVKGGPWDSEISERTLPFPTMGNVTFAAANDSDPTDFPTLTYSDQVTPLSYYRVHDLGGEPRLELLKQSPARFEGADLVTEQRFAVSRDGTRVPYFIVHKKGAKLNGENPTVLYGYGGFERSMPPFYSGTIGKLWLERGGVFVLANIRGGGEYGPKWHQAALKHNRQRAFDDFIAVAEDLHANRVTSPRHLGIWGGSNGGLLTGTVMVQRPDLFNAALISVPLLDMARYAQLLAGASWIGEYGDPANPEDLGYLLSYSPYQNVKAGVNYPTPLLTTSTKDDRVHPGHARKMVARMRELGHPVHYFENVNGGHGGSANLDESARVSALEFTYFWERLGVSNE